MFLPKGIATRMIERQPGSRTGRCLSVLFNFVRSSRCLRQYPFRESPGRRANSMKNSSQRRTSSASGVTIEFTQTLLQGVGHTSPVCAVSTRRAPFLMQSTSRRKHCEVTTIKQHPSIAEGRK